MTYGPCSGLTRLERWYRADKLGKNPPLYIRDILIDAAKQQQDIFNNNNTSKSSQSKQPTVSQVSAWHNVTRRILHEQGQM